jgi:tetratricopeptide (TPR) repeat protein
MISGVVSTDIESRAKVDFLGKLGLILNAKGKPVKGAQLLSAVLSIDPDNALARNELAEILRKLNAQRAPQITAPSPHMNGLVDQHLRKAGKLVEVNDLEGAEKEYRKVIAIDNLNDSAYVQLVMIYAIRDDKAKMIEVLTQYLAALPPDNSLHFIVEEQIRKLKEMRD